MTKPNLAARAARLNKRDTAPANETVEAAPVKDKTAPVVRTKPIRITLDLAPQPYRQLKGVCDELAGELGRATVPAAEVIRALLAQLDTDQGLRNAVTEQIRENSRK